MLLHLLGIQWWIGYSVVRLVYRILYFSSEAFLEFRARGDWFDFNGFLFSGNFTLSFNFSLQINYWSMFSARGNRIGGLIAVAYPPPSPCPIVKCSIKGQTLAPQSLPSMLIVLRWSRYFWNKLQIKFTRTVRSKLLDALAVSSSICRRESRNWMTQMKRHWSALQTSLFRFSSK